MVNYGSQVPRDWSTGRIEKQHDLAVDAPDVLAFAIGAIRESGRGERADLRKVLRGIDRVLSAQMDAYAQGLRSVDADQVVAMRYALYRRSDFTFAMFFTGLTYFGAGGVAMCNGLAEQLSEFQPQLVGLIADGNFDRD